MNPRLYDLSVTTQRFDVRLIADLHDRVYVPIPFDPDALWGVKTRHHVAGTVNEMGVRGVIENVLGGRGLVLGPAWRHDCGLAAGDLVAVVLAPEGPQRHDLAEDVGTALAGNPKAGDFFDSLAQYYRNVFLRWIDATKRSPAKRTERIARMVELLDSGIKEVPGR